MQQDETVEFIEETSFSVSDKMREGNFSVYRTDEGSYRWTLIARFDFILFITLSTLIFYSATSIYFNWFNEEDLAIINFYRRNSPFFLSLWNAISGFVYLALTCAIHSMESSDERSLNNAETIRRLDKTRDCILFSVMLPMSFVVTVLFWAVFVHDREQIFPRALDAYPSFTIMNHLFHSAPLPLTIFYVIASRRKEATNKSEALRGLLVFGLLYVVMILIVQAVQGSWMYPFMNRMTYSDALRLILFVIVASISCHHLGYAFVSAVQRVERSRDIKKNK